jgi:hypothetical protein
MFINQPPRDRQNDHPEYESPDLASLEIYPAPGAAIRLHGYHVLARRALTQNHLHLLFQTTEEKTHPQSNHRRSRQIRYHTANANATTPWLAPASAFSALAPGSHFTIIHLTYGADDHRM